MKVNLIIVNNIMIKYALICECDAEFEGWFPDSASFDKQKKAGLVTCPMCDSTVVAKAVMAPNLKRKSNQKTKAVGDKLMMSGKARQILKHIEKTVKKEFTDVGKKFPDHRAHFLERLRVIRGHEHPDVHDMMMV